MPVCFSSPRIRCVASRPSISGICTSISTRSNVAGVGCRDASLPLLATVTVCPCSFQQGHGQFLVDQAVLGQQDVQAADTREPLPATGSGISALAVRDAQGQLDGFQQLRLLDRLQQVGGNPQLLASPRCPPDGLPRSAS